MTRIVVALLAAFALASCTRFVNLIPADATGDDGGAPFGDATSPDDGVTGPDAQSVDDGGAVDLDAGITRD